MRVPVTVEQNHGVSCSEVDAEASGTCRQQEHKNVTGRVVELVNGVLAVKQLRAAVETHEAVGLRVQIVLQQVEHLRHLRKDQNLVSASFQPRQHPMQQFELSAGHDK